MPDARCNGTRAGRLRSFPSRSSGANSRMAARPISQLNTSPERLRDTAAVFGVEAQPLRLNLGCSDAHVKGWTNVDLCQPADWIADLSQTWPWPDSSIAELKSWDCFEHLPSKLFTMN